VEQSEGGGGGRQVVTGFVRQPFAIITDREMSREEINENVH